MSAATLTRFHVALRLLLSGEGNTEARAKRMHTALNAHVHGEVRAAQRALLERLLDHTPPNHRCSTDPTHATDCPTHRLISAKFEALEAP
ncbi:MAG: hypothetical protein A2V63_13385 [Candidatus Eisenbacteria bacterium RBG_19FT_COMBO_70_11]|nr:MAG: hypothetical protein A2V63_13385 [Candidatus Eisenbacteria bacterium RBG_19FT_COMBO_70_11]